ncbi:nitroreductase family protein, partial [Chloroflexota bacterium]
LFLDSALGSWSIFDTGLFAQAIILATHAHGLGSCLQGSLGNYPDAVREFLQIPKTKRLVLGISMGEPDLEARINSYHSTRVGLDDFVQWHS